MKKKKLIDKIQRHLDNMDMVAFNRRVMEGMAWRGRCRCEICERLRAAGKAGMDGIGPREKV